MGVSRVSLQRLAVAAHTDDHGGASAKPWCPFLSDPMMRAGGWFEGLLGFVVDRFRISPGAGPPPESGRRWLTRTINDLHHKRLQKVRTWRRLMTVRARP